MVWLLVGSAIQGVKFKFYVLDLFYWTRHLENDGYVKFLVLIEGKYM